MKAGVIASMFVLTACGASEGGPSTRAQALVDPACTAASAGRAPVLRSVIRPPNLFRVRYLRLFGGHYAYASTGAIVDVADPAHPVEVGRGPAGIGVDVSGAYAYVTLYRHGDHPNGGLLVVDVSNPAAPVQVGSLSALSLGGAWTVTVAGRYAYVGGYDYPQQVSVVDVSDPTSPVVVGHTPQIGSFASVALAGSHLLAAMGNSLMVFDVSDPSNPRRVRDYYDITNLGGATGVSVVGNRAYVVAGSENSILNTNAVSAFDITNPANPVRLGTLKSPDLAGAESVWAAGSTVYVAARNRGALTVVDASDPAAMRVTGVLGGSDLAGATGVGVLGDLAVVAARGASGLVAVDVRDAAAPVELGTLTARALDTPRDVAVAGRHAFVANDGDGTGSGSLAVWDVGDRDRPALVSFLTGPSFRGASGVTLRGDRAYVTAGIYTTTRSLNVVDVSDVTRPRLLGTASGPSLAGAAAVDVVGSYAYVVAGGNQRARSLTVVDVSDPAAPVPVGTVASPHLDWGHDVRVSGRYAYVVTSQTDHFTVVDVADPRNPVEVAHLTGDPDLSYVFSLELSGNYAYVASSGASGVTVIDISDPLQPRKVGALNQRTLWGQRLGRHLGGARGIGLWCGNAYVGGFFYDGTRSLGALSVVNLANPLQPLETAGAASDELRWPSTVRVVDGFAYMPQSYEQRLAVVDLAPGRPPGP